MNQGLEVDYDMKPDPNHVTLVNTPADEKLFEGQTWGWDGTNRRSVVAQDYNEPSFKNVWIPQILSYIKILIHCLPLNLLRIVLLPSMYRYIKEAGIAPSTYVYLLGYLGLWLLISTCYGWKRKNFWSVTPFDQEKNPCHYLLREFMYY